MTIDEHLELSPGLWGTIAGFTTALYLFWLTFTLRKGKVHR